MPQLVGRGFEASRLVLVAAFLTNVHWGVKCHAGDNQRAHAAKEATYEHDLKVHVTEA